MNWTEVWQGELGIYTVPHACGFQVDALERDTLEMFRLLRPVQDSFVPMNRLPLEVLRYPGLLLRG